MSVNLKQQIENKLKADLLSALNTLDTLADQPQARQQYVNKLSEAIAAAVESGVKDYIKDYLNTSVTTLPASGPGPHVHKLQAP